MGLGECAELSMRGERRENDLMKITARRDAMMPP